MSSTTFEEKKTLPFTQEQLFHVVADVGSYADFLPWCVGSRIIEQNDEFMIADLIIGYKVIREKFRSKVRFEQNKLITVEYLSGPLQNLHNRWRFIDNKDGTTTIDFYVEFEFKNPLLKHLVSIFFDEIIKRMVDAFEERATKLYRNKDGNNEKNISA